MGPHLPPLQFYIHDEAGHFLGYAKGLLYESTILAYDPSTNKAEWILVRGSVKTLTPAEQVSAMDLSKMVLHSPIRGGGSPPVPPSRLRKFAKERRGGGDVMEEGEETEDTEDSEQSPRVEPVVTKAGLTTERIKMKGTCVHWGILSW